MAVGPNWIVKRCSACGWKTFARRQYQTICRGEHGPPSQKHSPRIMVSVVQTRRLQLIPAPAPEKREDG